MTGAIRAHQRPLESFLEGKDPRELEELGRIVRQRITQQEVTFNILGVPEGTNRPWQLDAVPLVLDRAEWQALSAGLRQRARLLDAVLRDCYGPQLLLRDGLLPPVFGKVHPKFQTPYVTTILTGVVAAVIAGYFPIGLLGELVSIGTLLAFVIVCAGVIVLRYRQPNLERPFRTPLVPLVPILGIISCGALMGSLPSDTWIRLIVWMGLGLLIYFLYGKSHSKLGRAEKVGA